MRHLELWYAQSHPAEDFAETFAVWLDPSSKWPSRYKDWPALSKLQYVDELMGVIEGKKPTRRGKERLRRGQPMCTQITLHGPQRRMVGSDR